MAMIMWAKSAAGTNLGFIRDISRILKSWREVVKSTIQQKRSGYKPRLQETDTQWSEAKEKCLVQLQPSLLSRSGKSLQSRIFHSVFSKSATRTVASELRRQSALRFSSNSGRNFRSMPIMSLIGVSVGVNVTTLMDDGAERMMSELQENFKGFTCKAEQLKNVPKCLDDLVIDETSIANGCEGAVYKAKVKFSSEEPAKNRTVEEEIKVDDTDYDLALKAVFNYGAESNAFSILRDLEREIVPVRHGGHQLETPLGERVGRLPPHPNIVDMPGIFIDDMIVTEEGMRKFPAALPHRLDPDNFYGHNKTLYLVMRRRSSHLRDFLSNSPVTMATRCQILAQLLEGVSHLTKNGVAHRDLKADNILVDSPNTGGCPRVEICDFGCCLAEDNQSLKVPYVSRDMYLGGNTWLMAPEITTATPGPHGVLDYSKSDLWAVGALAFEIFGERNPFYPGDGKNSDHRQLHSRSYCESNIPSLPDEVPEPVRSLVKALLSRDPVRRPSASVAAAVAQMVALSITDQTTSQWKTASHPVHKKAQRCYKGKVSKHHTRNHTYNTGTSKTTTGSELALATVSRDRKWLNWILGHGLALLCQLTLWDQSKPWDMEAIMKFQFLSHLTYADFKQALHYFGLP